MTDPVLKATKVRKVLTKPQHIEILKGISLQINHGESLAIMGASGEGKTTLLHLLGTLDRPTSGTLEVMGNEMSASAPNKVRNAHIGFVFQSYNLLDDHSVLENVLMPAVIGRQNTQPGSPAFKRACELLDRVGLSRLAHYPAKLLSGGEKQRVAIARALCNNPDLILADEPSGNLDNATSQEVHSLLLDCVNIENKALIVVTHDPVLAGLCDKILYLEGGVLVRSDENT
jgi:lipoprotein-releasing system ATP-binding protein